MQFGRLHQAAPGLRVPTRHAITHARAIALKADEAAAARDRSEAQLTAPPLAAAMNDLLENVLEAHGGLARWNKFSTVRVQIVTGGGLWALKGLIQDPSRGR